MKTQHDSDCSLHNMPAFPAGPCDCGVDNPFTIQRTAVLEHAMPLDAIDAAMTKEDKHD